MSAAAVTTEIVTALGVLGVGSVLGQYLASSKDRRETRARVLTAFADAESVRWVDPDSKTRAEFQTSLRELQTAALVARLPRGAVLEYAVLAQAAHRECEVSWERNSAGEIDARLADATREAARARADIAWSSMLMHNWRWRVVNGHVLRRSGSIRLSPRCRWTAREASWLAFANVASFSRVLTAITSSSDPAKHQSVAEAGPLLPTQGAPGAEGVLVREDVKLSREFLLSSVGRRHRSLKGCIFRTCVTLGRYLINRLKRSEEHTSELQ